MNRNPMQSPIRVEAAETPSEKERQALIARQQHQIKVLSERVDELLAQLQAAQKTATDWWQEALLWRGNAEKRAHCLNDFKRRIGNLIKNLAREIER